MAVCIDEHNKKKKKYYAMKKIRQTFEHKLYAIRTIREIKLMRLFDHCNVPDFCFRLRGAH